MGTQVEKMVHVPATTASANTAGTPSGVQLAIVRGVARNRLRTIHGPAFMIGTGSDCDLVLAAPDFPEVHSYLLITPRGIWVRYLGAGPAITVNGRVVQSAELSDGAALEIGPYGFRLHVESSLQVLSTQPSERPHSASGWQSVTSDRAIVVPRATG